MEAHRVGLPLAVGIAVFAAGAATFALRPRHGLIHPAPVAAEAYFSPSELERAQDYRGPQRLLGPRAGAGPGGACARGRPPPLPRAAPAATAAPGARTRAAPPDRRGRRRWG